MAAPTKTSAEIQADVEKKRLQTSASLYGFASNIFASGGFGSVAPDPTVKGVTLGV